jgi:preprotein translocase subunit SecA
VISNKIAGKAIARSRLSDDLHHVIETKQGVKIVREFRTDTIVTMQNYLGMNEKLAEMTDPAET